MTALTYGQRPGWWARGKAAHWSHVGPFDTATEAAAYAEEYMPVDAGWSRVSVNYKKTNR